MLSIKYFLTVTIIALSISAPIKVIANNIFGNEPSGTIKTIIEGDQEIIIQLNDDDGFDAIDIDSAVLNLSINGNTISSSISNYDTDTGIASIDIQANEAIAGQEITVTLEVSDIDQNAALLTFSETVQEKLDLEFSINLDSEHLSTRIIVLAGTVVSYETSDPSVISVDDTGMVTALSQEGTATITATDASGNQDSVIVTIFPPYDPYENSPSGITISGTPTTAMFDLEASSPEAAARSRKFYYKGELIPPKHDLFEATDSISVRGTIYPETGQIGATGSLYLLVKVSNFYFYKDIDGIYTLMGTDENGDLIMEHLEPYTTSTTLESSIPVTVVENLIPGEAGLAGIDYEILIFYSTDSSPNELYYNGIPFGFTVSIE